MQQPVERKTDDNILKLWAWVIQNQKRLITLATILFVAFLAWFSMTSYRESQQQAAGYALSRVMPARLREPMSPAEQAQAFLKVVQDHPGSTAARHAMLQAGSALFADGKYAEAKAQFETFLREDPGSLFASQADYGIAAALDAQNKTDEAIAKYEEVSRRYPNDGVSEKSKLALANLYATAKKPDQAYKMYDEIMKSSRGSGAGQQAFMKREELAQQFPYLRTNNVPPSPPAGNLGTSAMNMATNVIQRASNAVVKLTNQVIAATNKIGLPNSGSLPKKP